MNIAVRKQSLRRGKSSSQVLDKYYPESAWKLVHFYVDCDCVVGRCPVCFYTWLCVYFAANNCTLLIAYARHRGDWS